MRKRFTIVPLLLTIFLDIVGFGIAIPTLAVLLLDTRMELLPAAASFALRTRTYGWLIAAFPIAQFFGSPILGALSDRYGRKPMLILSMIGTFIGYILFAYGIAHGMLWLLFVSRAIAGFTGGNLAIALSSFADISTDEGSKARNFGLVGMAYALGLILGPYIGGKLADPNVVAWFNPTVPFWFAAIFAGLNVLFFLILFKETLINRTHTPVSLLTGTKNIIRAFGIPNLRTMFIVIFLLTLGFNFFVQSFQVFLVEKFHFNEGQIGDLFAYTALWVAFSQGILTRPLTRRMKPAKLLAYAAFFAAFMFPILTFPNSVILLYALLPFLAIFQGLIVPNSTAVISELATQEAQGEILGINQSVQCLGMIIPPLISGEILAAHVDLPMHVAGILTLIAWIVLVMRFRPQHEEAFKG